MKELLIGLGYPEDKAEMLSKRLEEFIKDYEEFYCEKFPFSAGDVKAARKLGINLEKGE